MQIVPFAAIGVVIELMKKADLENKYHYGTQALTGLKLSDGGITGALSFGADVKSASLDAGLHYTLGLGRGSVSHVFGGKLGVKF